MTKKVNIKTFESIKDRRRDLAKFRDSEPDAKDGMIIWSGLTETWPSLIELAEYLSIKVEIPEVVILPEKEKLDTNKLFEILHAFELVRHIQPDKIFREEYESGRSSNEPAISAQLQLLIAKNSKNKELNRLRAIIALLDEIIKEAAKHLKRKRSKGLLDKHIDQMFEDCPEIQTQTKAANYLNNKHRNYTKTSRKSVEKNSVWKKYRPQ